MNLSHRTYRVVGFSGGIDSQACALWVRQRWPDDTLLLFADTGHEHPLTYAFVRDYSERVHPVVFVTPLVRDLGDVGTVEPEIGRRRRQLGEDAPLTFETLAWVKMFFPRSRMRFCTEYLKLQPQVRWLKENMTPGAAWERYVGVRADESPARAQLPEDEDDPLFDCPLHRPLHKWRKHECFAFVAAAGEAVNPLYRLGMERVGCSPCVAQPKEQIREWAARFPPEVERVRAMERRVGKPFYAGKVAGLEGWVDEVVAWSRTERGGKQLSLPFAEQGDGQRCVSSYGLCE